MPNLNAFGVGQHRDLPRKCGILVSTHPCLSWTKVYRWSIADTPRGAPSHAPSFACFGHRTACTSVGQLFNTKVTACVCQFFCKVDWE